MPPLKTTTSLITIRVIARSPLSNDTYLQTRIHVSIKLYLFHHRYLSLGNLDLRVVTDLTFSIYSCLMVKIKIYLNSIKELTLYRSENLVHFEVYCLRKKNTL